MVFEDEVGEMGAAAAVWKVEIQNGRRDPEARRAPLQRRLQPRVAGNFQKSSAALQALLPDICTLLVTYPTARRLILSAKRDASTHSSARAGSVLELDIFHFAPIRVVEEV